MNRNILYIIGNGFDLYHDIKSEFKNFGEYVKEKHHTLFHTIEYYFDNKCLWSDFEYALSTLDTELLKKEASQFLVPYGYKNWKDAYHHDYQFIIEETVNLLTITLKKLFIEWVNQLSIPDNLNEKKLNFLRKDGIYITFNYTETLYSVYKIPESNVIHIHGRATKKDSDIILGHAYKPKNKKLNHLQDILSDDSYTEEDIRITQGNKIIEQYFIKTYKPTKQIIESKKEFFFIIKQSRNHLYIRTFYFQGRSCLF